MSFWPLFWSVYVLISIFAITMTYKEQKKSNRTTPVFVFIGYLACTVWPLLVAVMLVLLQITKRRGARRQQRARI